MVEPFQRRPFRDNALDASRIDVLGDDSSHHVVDFSVGGPDQVGCDLSVTTVTKGRSETALVLPPSTASLSFRLSASGGTSAFEPLSRNVTSGTDLARSGGTCGVCWLSTSACTAGTM